MRTELRWSGMISGNKKNSRYRTTVIRLLIGLVTLVGWTMTAVAQDANNACISCHAGLDDDDLVEPVGEWRASVHNPAGIACQDCHGGNPATQVEDDAHDPAAGFIGEPEPEQIHEVCGSCHQLQTDNYLPSPHGIEGEFWPSCVDCHGNHEVALAVAAQIAVPDKCEDCHEQDVLDDFIAVVDRGLMPIENFRSAAVPIKAGGVPVEQILMQANMAEDAFRSRASHVFVLTDMIAVVDSLEATYPTIEKSLESADTELSTRRKFGWIFAVFFVLMAGTIWLYKRSLP